MIIRPSPIKFGLEGQKEIVESNLIEIQNLFEQKLISETVYKKMMQVVLNNNKNLQ